MMIPRFPAGRLVATPAASESIPHAVIAAAIARHVAGDFGDLDAHDVAVNERAIIFGTRILSAYSHDGITFWIITEADRSRTTALLPNEY